MTGIFENSKTDEAEPEGERGRRLAPEVSKGQTGQGPAGLDKELRLYS